MQTTEASLSKEFTKNKLTNPEEEVKFDVVIAQSTNSSKLSLSPSNSIFGKATVKTVLIQESPPQYEDLKKNEKPLHDPLESHSPFVKFPNILTDFAVSGPTSNAFFDSFFLAYALHGDLVLSPDDIWLQINNCFATYVNNYPEELRSKIVTFEGKKDLIVLYNDQSPDFHDMTDKSFRWDIIVDNFKGLIKENTIGAISDLIECNFSTTGAIEKIASQVCEKFFNYRGGKCGCGIQKVHFVGEDKDWVALKEKLQKLKNYSLPQCREFLEWIENLEIILDNFIDTYRNKANVAFWNTVIQKFQGYELKIGGSGYRSYELSEFVNGWILDFFLYDKNNGFFKNNLIDQPLEKPDLADYETTPEERVKMEERNFYIKKQKGTLLNCFPAAIWKAPVLIEYCYGPKKGNKIPVNFFGGFTGVVKENNIYRPQTSFAVGFRKITDEENNFKPLWKMI